MTSPFIVGAEVYVDRGEGYAVKKRKIIKVHKTGNFLLEGSDQQYRPYEQFGVGNTKSWYAIEAGSNVVRSARCECVPVNDETTKRFSERNVAIARRHRAYALQQRIHRMSSSHFTDAMLDAIEAALDGRKV